jgi:hypothetical protein
LAELEHWVIAQDLSPVGLAMAAQLTAERGLQLQISCCDLQNFEPEAESFVLVVAIWMHLPPILRAQVNRRMVEALRSGGLVILEAYSPSQLEMGSGGPPSLEMLQSAQQLKQELSGLEWLVMGEQKRWIEEGPYHHGQSAVVQACVGMGVN